MTGVRTRRGDRGAHRRMFKVIDATTITGYPESVENPGAVSFVWSGSEYFDNGYGFYFDYNVEVPEDENKEIRLDDMTRKEAEAKRAAVVKQIGPGTVAAFYRSGGDAWDSPKKGDAAKVEKADPYELNDLQYIDAIIGLFDYWGDTSIEDIKSIGRFKRYNSKTGAEDAEFDEEMP